MKTQKKIFFIIFFFIYENYCKIKKTICPSYLNDSICTKASAAVRQSFNIMLKQATNKFFFATNLLYNHVCIPVCQSIHQSARQSLSVDPSIRLSVRRSVRMSDTIFLGKIPSNIIMPVCLSVIASLLLTCSSLLLYCY